MGPILSKIGSPADIKKLSPEEFPELAKELREYIVECVANTGGHLASSLGAIELTIALHYVFNAPDDKIVWDVGHQAYAHKILTGRKEGFRYLRTSGGVSGFPKPSESEYDSFVAGHSSTSISAALGMAAARDLKNGTNAVVAVIGDGSMTAGLAFEGLNQAGHLKKDMIVVLNDNEMSISENVGALQAFLSRKITGRLATKFKIEVETFIKSIPRIGDRLMGIARKAEDSLITFFTPGMLFEGLGFHYVGPLDGHDTASLVEKLKDVRTLKGPVLLHVLTKKGKGYAPAEAEPSVYHGIGPFDAATGAPKKEVAKAKSYTSVFSDALMDIAASNERVVAITAAMPEGTGLSKFSGRFPKRFFDVGIAEQHALTFAGGLAKEGYIPVCAIYSTFLQRAYDEVFHDIALQDLPVVIAMDRAGIVGQDGPTHHGVFDIAYLRHIPNMIVCAPKDEGELRDLLYSATLYGHPTAIRYPRGSGLGVDTKRKFLKIEAGAAEVLRDGKAATILALGSMVEPALKAAFALEKGGISVTVVNSRFVKPLDERLILKLAASTGAIITVEEGALQGGFGSAVMELLEENDLSCRVRRLGIPDEFVEHGAQDELRSKLGLDSAGIARAIKELLAAGEEGRTSEKLAN